MPDRPILIDGSQGEGGGQILRTSLALSLVTRKPFRIERIRAGREKPGLLRQHLTAVQAASAIGGAAVEGDQIGSKELSFTPGKIAPGNHKFSVGTAGSATLVFQAILPALMTASGPSSLTLEGGTHNPFAPPFDFLERTFLPVLRRMGPEVVLQLKRPGFYPAGGGLFTAEIRPCSKLKPIDLLERGECRTKRARAIVARLPRLIAEREIAVLKRRLTLADDQATVEATQDGNGPGNIVMIEFEHERVTEIITGFGEKGVKAEAVAESAVKEARRYMVSNAPVGEHLADQLLLPFALAGGGSFRAITLSRHARTNLEVIRRFLDVEMAIEQDPAGGWLVKAS